MFTRILLSLGLFAAPLLAAPAQDVADGDLQAAPWQDNTTCETCHTDSQYLHRYPEIEITTEDINGTVHANFACVDCHFDGYDDYPHNKLMHRANCSDCHEDQLADYEHSNHFKARQAGNLEAPDCVDCHGFHDIQDPAVQLGGANAVATCSKCHGDKLLTSELKLRTDILDSYSSSYHGEMYRLGFEGDEYATCVSCHDNHAIRSSDDPASTIARENLVQTCAQCHEDANESFAGYLTHWSPGDGQSKTLDGAFLFMEALLIGVMIFFGIHTFLWFLRTLLTAKFRAGVTLEPVTKVVRRFTTKQRLMHVVLILCFLSLSLTGLPVKFGDTAFAQWIANNLIGFEAAATVHRVAGVTLCLLFLVHVLDLLHRSFVKKEAGMFWGPNSMVPNGKDFADFFGHIAYFLFLRKTPPKFDRWTYWEKFDYFAVFWGMVIIGFSGMALMVPIGATSILPGWSLNLAHLVHSEEALLATAFIFVVHFFNTHLRPNAFPLDDVIFTGGMSLERLKEERPAEFERLESSGQLEALVSEPLGAGRIALYRLGGLVFLLIGLTLLVLILYGIAGS